MITTWKKKFTSRELGLTEEEPINFVLCQWQRQRTKPKIWYLIYRWIVALYFLVTWLLSILIVKQKTDGFQAKWLIYLTNWGYTMCTFQALLAATILSACLLSTKLNEGFYLQEKALKLYKIYWLTNIIATVVACGITIIYWSFIYDEKTNDLDAMNIFLHAMNTVVMTFDFWMVSHPFRLFHFIYPVTFAAFYGIFSIFYYLAGGTSREGFNYIYPILKWEHPHMAALTCLAVAIFFIIIHLWFIFMYWLRTKLHRKFYGNKTTELQLENDNKKSSYANEAVITDEV